MMPQCPLQRSPILHTKAEAAEEARLGPATRVGTGKKIIDDFSLFYPRFFAMGQFRHSA
jgi:hypothetical protein